MNFTRRTIIISDDRRLYVYDFEPDAEETTSTMTESDRAANDQDDQEDSTRS